MARPMPRLAPVRIAVLFFKETDFISSFRLGIQTVLINASIESGGGKAG